MTLNKELIPSWDCYRTIKTFEGLELEAYLCPANVWTIGYGHTKNVKEGDKISRAEADKLLVEDVAKFAKAVNRLAKDCTQCQFDALVSFAFNLGIANLEKSTLLKRHNAGLYDEAQAQFLVWNKANGKVLAGLQRRRNHEAALYGLDGRKNASKD